MNYDFGEENVFTVSELNLIIKNLINNTPFLQSICVTGEISNFKRQYSSGHMYFSLKDEKSAVRCVMFNSAASRLRFIPEDGMSVFVYGHVSVYERDGAYQLYCEKLLPIGVGDLQLAFEQLFERLKNEGLFSQEHKKRLPQFPQTIAVITSASGDAVRDIINISGRRWPLARINLIPVKVQGEESGAELTAAVKYADKYKLGDVIIIGRGGGSYEDLFSFNDEALARAIYNCSIPVISAVGHEPDVTICDFVADARASTPSNGAELAVPDKNEVRLILDSLEEKLNGTIEGIIELYKSKLSQHDMSKLNLLMDYFFDSSQNKLKLKEQQINAFADNAINERQAALAKNAAFIDASSPLKQLARGYSVVKDKDGKVISSKESVNSGDDLEITVSDGSICCTVI